MQGAKWKGVMPQEERAIQPIPNISLFHAGFKQSGWGKQTPFS
jgi:hypothetical protein